MLGFESCILMKQMEPDAWLPGGIGEVAEAERITTLEYAPRGTGRDHVCGTAEEFRVGGEYLPDEPPVEYGALGLPLCCNPPKKVRGGAGVSGRAVLVIAPAIAPGPDCASAGVAEFGATVSYEHPGGLVLQWWVVTLPSVPGIYHVATTAADPSRLVQMFSGSSCGMKTNAYSGDMLFLCVTVGVGDPTFDKIWVAVGSTLTPQPAGNYTFQVLPGACP